MDVIILNRISTDNKDQDPESNLVTTKEFSKKNELKVIDILIDKGISGSIAYYDRPEAKKIDNYIEEYQKKKKPLGILVFSIDRFSRQHPVDALFIIKNLKDKNVQIFSATEPIFNEEHEFSLPMQFNILWFNWYWLKQHSKKVKAGNAQRKAKGLHLGRGLIKKVIGTGKNRKFIYYTEQELDYIHSKIKSLSKKHSYREIIKIFQKDDNIKLSLGYINSVINNK